MNASVTRIILLSMAAVAASLLYFFWPATGHSFYPECPFHWLTGAYCPGCGSQRAFSALVHGEWTQAAGYNVLFVLAVPLIAYAGAVTAWNAFSRRPLRLRLFYSKFFARLILVIVLCFWLLRNIPVYPFSLLAP